MNEQEMKRLVREAQFTRAVDMMETAYSRPLIIRVEHVGENAFGCELKYASWAALARKMATHLPGIVMPTRHGLVWICGSNGPHGTLIDNTPIDPLDPRDPKKTRLDCIIEARTAVSKTDYPGRVVWTLGGIGKRLLKWVGKPDEYRANCEHLFDGIEQGYHRCIPGAYGDETKLYDVSGYYYNLFTKVDAPNRSLRVVIGRNSASFYPWEDGERQRFQQIINAVKSVKPLRNAMIGAAQGSFEKGIAYTSSKSGAGLARKIEVPGKAGPFRAVALLYIRIGYELTQKEALTNNAVYSIIDSVMLPPGAVPSVWREYGLDSQLVQRGPAEVYCRGNYKIGNEAKVLYREGFRTTHKEQGEIVLPVQFHKKVLE